MTELEKVKIEILREIQKTNKSVKELHDKLFVGNGQRSIVVQIDRLNVFKAVMCWFVGVLTVSILALIGRLIYLTLS